MPPNRSRWRVSNFQAILLVLIALTYVKLFLLPFISLRWLENCQGSDLELQRLEDSMLTCETELKGKQKILGKDDSEAVYRLQLRTKWWSFEECSAPEVAMEDYMKYDTGGECPHDWLMVQVLLQEDSCSILPRRKCFARTPEGYEEPEPFPEALWRLPKKEMLNWELYSGCRDFECLPAKGCFRDGDTSFLSYYSSSSSRYTPNAVMNVASILELKNGEIKVGVDIGGFTGCFAALMATYNVVILTTAMNEGFPFLETLALRGLLGLQLAHDARLPFFDGSMDLVHASGGISGMSLARFELMLFDYDRVLRTGGILWVERLSQPEYIMQEFVALVKALGYREHEFLVVDAVRKWGEVGRKELTFVIEKHQ